MGRFPVVLLILDPPVGEGEVVPKESKDLLLVKVVIRV